MIATLPGGRTVELHSVPWCKKHDIAWASHSELGIWIEESCERTELLVEDKSKDW